MKQPNGLNDSIEHLFRHESGKMLAVLVKLFGLPHVEIAEDLVQETLLAAFETWKLRGLPDQPRAWLYRTAKNKTVDFLRRERNFEVKIAPNLRFETAQNAATNDWLDAFFLENEIEDAQLRMMFACCHPSIPVESQLVLMLRTLCGLSVREIAAAFLLPEETIAKRLFRAKEKIKTERLSLEVPVGKRLLPRLDAVLQAIYLLFNEGYKSASEAMIIRRELCEEAMRLGGLLARNAVGNLPKTHALQSLMCFHAARFDARLDAAGDIILLEKQDRSRWNRALIGLGYEHLHRASQGREVCEYHFEAAISSYHASAPTFAATNWKAIFYCYDSLFKINPSPIVALNRAIALSFSDSPSAGIAALKKIEGLEKNHLFHTALGDFYLKNEAFLEAKHSYQTALKFSKLPAERQLIQQKMASVSEAV